MTREEEVAVFHTLAIHVIPKTGVYEDFCHIDDKKAIVDWSYHWIGRLILGIVQIFFMWLGLVGIEHLFPLNNIKSIINFLIPIICYFLPGFIFFITNIINPDRKIIFNRIEGTVTMRASLSNWRNRKITFPFKDMKLNYWGHSNTMMAIRFPNAFFKFSNLMIPENDQDSINFLSFLVWYMDKNRPLPPDPRLDPYRKEDYLRRKAEGFPPPLFPAKVDTPEIDDTVPDIYKGENNNSNKIFLDEDKLYIEIHEKNNTKNQVVSKR